jgi:hypothetical protein
MQEQKKGGERRFPVLFPERNDRPPRPCGIVVYLFKVAPLPIPQANRLAYVLALGNDAKPLYPSDIPFAAGRRSDPF